MKKVLLFTILAIGLFLRVIGADWGLPLLLHPDEPVVAEIPADMAKRSSLDPNEYSHPDHIDIYANAVLYHAASYIKYGEPLTETFDDHKAFYYLLSRIFVALLGTACIAVAYLIGKEYEESMGLIASFVIAIFPSYVGHSHYITSDIPLTLFTLVIILFAIKYLKKPTDKHLIIMSLISALAVSVKYPGVLSVLLIMIVIIYKNYKDKRKMFFALFKALGSFLLFLFIVSPYLFINYQRVAESLTGNAVPVHLGADGLDWSGNLLFYAKTYLAFPGIVMNFFFIIGVFYIIRDEKQNAIPVFFGFLYWILLSRIGLHWERWALPMYTAPLLITAYGINTVYKKTLLVEMKYIGPVRYVAFLLIIFKLMLVSTVITAIFTLNDTLNVSYEFIKQRGITEENAFYEGYTPLCPGRPRVIFHQLAAHENKDFIILSSAMYNRFLAEKERYKPQNEFYHWVFSLNLIREFVPISEDEFSDPSFWANRSLTNGLTFLLAYVRDRDELLSGPTIKIYRIKG